MDLYTIRQQLNMGVSLTSLPLRVTYYSRVSTDHLEQQSSLKNQIDHFIEMIKNNPHWTYIPGYIDDGISGTTDYKRNNFMQMISDARKGKFDLIITKEISRFSRNTLDSIKYTRELLSFGVAVLFINDNINTALPDSELRLTIMASMAQDEIRRLSERVKFGMNRSIKNGNILGNNMLYGYRKDKLTGNLKIIPEEAKIVKAIFQAYGLYHISLNQIADTLNNHKIKTIQNKQWCPSTISRMLQNIKYKGYYCGKKTEIIDYMTKKVKLIPKDKWLVYKDNIKIPPIIDEQLWQKANDRLKSHKKTNQENSSIKISYQNRYPLSAKIYCADHQEVFYRRKQCKSTSDITWICSRYLHKGKKSCNSPHLRESELNIIFNDIIQILKIDIQYVKDLLLELYKNNPPNINNKISDLKKKKNKLLIKKDKLLELNIEGNLSNKEFNLQNNACNQELSNIQKSITILEKKAKNSSNISENNHLSTILNQKVFESLIHNKIIELLLDKIIVSKVNNNKENLNLQIFLNYSSNFFFKEKSLIPNIKTYEFKRGYNTTKTRRYIVKYQASLSFSNS